MDLSAFVNGFVLWLALIVIAASALLALARSSRRDRYGFIDPTGRGAFVLIVAGPILAAFVVFMPQLAILPIGDDSSQHPGPITDQIGDAWVWAASIVIPFRLYALASAIFITAMYYVQQRRLRTAGPDA
jgi:hypothetical protein